MFVQITNLEQNLLKEGPLISSQLAEFATSALSFPQHEQGHQHSARKAEQSEETSPPPLKKRKVSSSLVASWMTVASSVGQVEVMEKKPLHVDGIISLVIIIFLFF